MVDSLWGCMSNRSGQCSESWLADEAELQPEPAFLLAGVAVFPDFITWLTVTQPDLRSGLGSPNEARRSNVRQQASFEIGSEYV